MAVMLFWASCEGFSLYCKHEPFKMLNKSKTYVT